MCSRQEGITFSEEEENKAVEILDTSGDGLIQFEEFVSWWTTKVKQLACVRTDVPVRNGMSYMTACVSLCAGGPQQGAGQILTGASIYNELLL